MKINSLLLICTVVKASFDHTYTLHQNNETSTYFMDIYMGTSLQKKQLLVDTLANGTAINYDCDHTNSSDSIVHNDQPGVVNFTYGSYQGNYAEDGVCMEYEEDTCIEEFPFLEIENKTATDFEVDGVLSFNRYGLSDNSNRQLVKSFLNEVVFWNPTVQFDFSLPDDPKNSTVTFNGINSKNILYSSDKNHGVVEHSNKKEESTWTFDLHDTLWNDYTIFKAYENPAKAKQNCEATLASASPYIKIPVEDFQQLAVHIGRKYDQFKSNDTSIFADEPCQNFKLNNFTLIIEGMYYVITDTFYKRDVGGSCEVLIKPDLTVLETGKKGYYLGQPFMRAFITVLDYEKNTIGFANKKNNYGAEILGNLAPGPRRAYFKPIDEGKEDEELIPVDSTGRPIDNRIKPQPWKPDTTEASSSKSNPRTTLTLFIWFLVLGLSCTLCYSRYQKQKAEEENAANPSLEYDDMKDPPLLYREGGKAKSKKKKSNTPQDYAENTAINETLDESLDMSQDFDEEEQVGVVLEDGHNHIRKGAASERK